MTEINLLHISDLHMSKYEMREPIIPIRRESPGIFVDNFRKGYFAATSARYKLRALTKFIKDNNNLIDGVVISGDISTTGLEFDLKKALEFIDGAPGLKTPFPGIEPTLYEIIDKEHIILLPGNHDRYTVFNKLGKLGRVLGFLPGNKLFDSVFENYWKGNVVEIRLPKEDFVLGIFAADFSLKFYKDCDPFSPANWHAQGKVYDNVLGELIESTRTFKADYPEDFDKLAIWAIHFPPAPSDIETCSKLLDNAKLISAADACGVPVILSGHIHRTFIEQVATNTYVWACGTSGQYYAPEGNFCQLISINNFSNKYEIKNVSYKLNDTGQPLETRSSAEFIEDGVSAIIQIPK